MIDRARAIFRHGPGFAALARFFWSGPELRALAGTIAARFARGALPIDHIPGIPAGLGGFLMRPAVRASGAVIPVQLRAFGTLRPPAGVACLVPRAIVYGWVLLFRNCSEKPQRSRANA